MIKNHQVNLNLSDPEVVEVLTETDQFLNPGLYDPPRLEPVGNFNDLVASVCGTIHEPAFVQCSQRGCTAEATKSVPWPGHSKGEIDCCTYHAAKAVLILGKMGIDAIATDL